MNKQRVVMFARTKDSVDELPETFVYEGHPDDALFEFIYQQLGYTITVVEVTDGGITAKPL